MSERSILVPHVPTDHGLTLDLSPQDAGWTHIGFQLLRLPAGESWEGQTGGREVGLVGVAGVARVRSHAGQAVAYTLTVALDHTYFVGSARVLVHNCAAKTGGGDGAFGLRACLLTQM